MSEVEDLYKYNFLEAYGFDHTTEIYEQKAERSQWDDFKAEWIQNWDQRDEKIKL